MFISGYHYRKSLQQNQFVFYIPKLNMMMYPLKFTDTEIPTILQMYV